MNETTWELDIDRQKHETRQQRGKQVNPLFESCQGMCRPKGYGFRAPFWSGIGYGIRGNYGSV